MTTVDELRRQLTETVTRLGELEQAAVDAMLEAKPERDVSALEVRKAQARERVVLLQRTIKQLEGQQQLADQQRMLDQTMATISPLVAPLDEAASKLALPPHTGPTQSLEPETIKAKTSGKWIGAPKQGSGRWNERLR
jgi:hypothetical protein